MNQKTFFSIFYFHDNIHIQGTVPQNLDSRLSFHFVHNMVYEPLQKMQIILHTLLYIALYKARARGS